MYVCNIAVRPVLEFAVPNSTTLPQTLNLTCSVKRANPNFSIAIKEKDRDESDVHVLGNKTYGYFSARVNKAIYITIHEKASRTFQCLVTWKNTKNTLEYILEEKTTEFLCEHIQFRFIKYIYI